MSKVRNSAFEAKKSIQKFMNGDFDSNRFPGLKDFRSYRPKTITYEEAKEENIPAQGFISRDKPSILSNLEIQIMPEALRDILTLVHLSPMEISWMGKVDRQGSLFTIYDIFVPEQECSSINTDMDDESLSQYFSDVIENEGIDEYEKIKFWGHSHVDMSTSPSGTDDKQMEEWADSNDWFVRGIFNKLGGAQFWIYFYNPEIVVENVPWSIHFDPDHPRTQELEQIISERVKYEKFSSYRTQTKFYNPFMER